MHQDTWAQMDTAAVAVGRMVGSLEEMGRVKDTDKAVLEAEQRSLAEVVVVAPRQLAAVQSSPGAD